MGAAMSAEKIWQLVIEGVWDTLYMTIPSTILAYLIGLPLGVLLVITKKGHIKPAPTFNAVLGSAMRTTSPLFSRLRALSKTSDER